MASEIDTYLFFHDLEIEWDSITQHYWQDDLNRIDIDTVPVVEKEVFEMERLLSMPSINNRHRHVPFLEVDLTLFEYFESELIYPIEAKEKGIQGTVVIKFDVDRFGKVSNVEVVRGVHELIDIEALKVVKNMPTWKTNNNMFEKDKASIRFTIPVRFRL